MLTFEKAMEFTRTISTNAAFEDEECRLYFDTLMSLAPGSLIVEIGLQYGRSSSIAVQVAVERDLTYFGVDPFVDHPEVQQAWLSGVLWKFKSQEHIYYIDDTSAACDLPDPIDAILIDGDHDYDGVLQDCCKFLPKIAMGGYAMFHDYQRESLMSVTDAVDHYLKHTRAAEWKHVATAGTLAIWRRV